MANKKKAKKVVAEPKHQVWAYYTDSEGVNWDKDSQIRKAAGKEDFGSGYGGERDISFFAQNMAHALRMKDRILSLPFVSHVEISVEGGGGYTDFTKRNKKGKWHNYL